MSKPTINFAMALICCAPLASSFQQYSKDPLGLGFWPIVVAFCGVMFTIYQLIQLKAQEQRDISFQISLKDNADKLRDSEQRIESLKKELIIASLPPEIINDPSEDAQAWIKIQTFTTEEPLRNYLEDYPESRFAKQAGVHINQIRNWSKIDKADPFAIDLFLLTNPYSALAELVRTQHKEALQGVAKSRCLNFWDVTGARLIPLLVLSILVFLYYLYSTLGFWVDTRNPVILEIISYLRSLLNQALLWVESLEIDQTSKILHRVKQNGYAIIRLLCIVITIILSFYIVIWLEKFLRVHWITPVKLTLKKQMQDQVDSDFKSQSNE